MEKVIVIVGPTGVGKTKLSILLAKKYDGEIINADSTQVYREMDIATAKVTEKEKEEIVHHLLDMKHMEEDYTVYHYQQDARKVIDDILKRGKTPIMVGGTGLYIKASLYDYRFDAEGTRNEYEGISNHELYQRLKKVDPNTEIHENNRKRIVRALNYYEEHHESISQKEKAEKILYPSIMIGLTTDREILYQRINDRVDHMLENGLLDEAKKIYDSNIRSKAVMTPIGYKELFPYFEGTSSLEDALDLMKKNSRHYAKRQYTWFRHQLPVHWIDVNFNDFHQTVMKIETLIENSEEE